MNGVKKDQPGRGNGASVTVRFAIDLAKPTEETTVNEYSYEQLLEEQLKDKKKKPEISNDPLSQDSNDELAAIAKRLEEKYGPKKRKKFHDTDLIDRGSGYDIADSFVDDTELYEDYVPHLLDTKFGGFYINMGNLEFKTAEDVEDDELDFITSKKFKKPLKIRKHSSFQTPQAYLASQKLKKAKQQMQKTAASGSAAKKPPTSKLMGKPVIGSAKAADNSTPIRPPPVKKIKLSEPTKSTSNNTSSASPSKMDVHSPKKVDTSTMLSVNISEMMSSLPVVNLTKKLMSQPEIVSGSGNNVGAGSSTEEVQITQVPKEPPVLPPKLPSLVQDKVVELEQMIVRDQGADGKLSNKARMSYDKHLVDIHVRCQGLPARTRNGVLDYLGYKMGVSRLTLVKRMKQELKKVEENELGKCIADLKRAIDAAIPEQIEAYESEVRARAESLSFQFTAEKQVSEPDEDSHAEEVFDETTASSAGPAPQTPSSSQKKPPRKRFRWNEELKKLLCKVVKVKIECEKKWVWGSKGNPDEIIGNFLEEKIKPLWPKGWMQKSILFKITETAHRHYTSVARKGNIASLLKTDASSPLRLSTSATSVSTTAAVAPAAAVVQQKPGHLPVGIPQTSSAPSLLSSSESSVASKLESKVSSIKKELEVLKSTSQRNDGGITSRGLGGTFGLSGADGRKKLMSSSKIKLVSISVPPSSSAAAAPKFKSSSGSSSSLSAVKSSLGAVKSSPPLKVSTGAISMSAATSKGHHTTVGSPTSSTGTKGGVLLKPPASAITTTTTTTTTTSTNPVTYLLSNNSLNVAQFIQDLHKQQLQQQQQQQRLPATVTTTTTSSQGAASNNFLVASTKGLTGKAIAKKPSTAKKLTTTVTTASTGKPTAFNVVRTTAVPTSSKIASSASPTSVIPASSKQIAPKFKTAAPFVHGSVSSRPTTTPASKLAPSSKPVSSSKLTGVSELLCSSEMQNLKELVDRIVSGTASSASPFSTNVKPSLPPSLPRVSSSGQFTKTMFAPVQVKEKEKGRLTLASQKTPPKVLPQVGVNRQNQKAPPSQVVGNRRGSPVGGTVGSGSGTGMVPRVSGSGMEVGGGSGSSVVVGGPRGVSVVSAAGVNSGRAGAGVNPGRAGAITTPFTSTVGVSAGKMLMSSSTGVKTGRTGVAAATLSTTSGAGTGVHIGRVGTGMTLSTSSVSVTTARAGGRAAPSTSAGGVSVINVGRNSQDLVRSISVSQVNPKPAAAEGTVRSKLPPPLISADALDWSDGKGSPSSAIVIPDTPPLSLSIAANTPGGSLSNTLSAETATKDQLYMPLSLSPSSPLRSPVEQIFEEHSYLATSSPP